MSKICCFTGSRDIDDFNASDISRALEEVLVNLIENEDYTDFRAGGAVGFDTIAALCVLNLKRRYPHIKLHLFLPCKNQDKFFSLWERKYYFQTIKYADSITYTQEHYSDSAMMKRNMAMVDGSDICVAFLTKLTGGTYNTVKYAKRKNVPVKNIRNLV